MICYKILQVLDFSMMKKYTVYIKGEIKTEGRFGDKITIASKEKAMEKLIRQACGARRITEYTRTCGISPMHVSRLKSGISKPSKKMWVKLSSDSYVKQLGISSEDFMKVAGYTDEEEIDCINTFEKNDKFLGSICFRSYLEKACE